MIDAIKGETEWSINYVVLDIIETARDFVSIDFIFILRKFNKSAHRLQARPIWSGMQ